MERAAMGARRRELSSQMGWKMTRGGGWTRRFHHARGADEGCSKSDSLSRPCSWTVGCDDTQGSVLQLVAPIPLRFTFSSAQLLLSCAPQALHLRLARTLERIFAASEGAEECNRRRRRGLYFDTTTPCRTHSHRPVQPGSEVRSRSF